jgi:hypothetical protein
MDKQTYRWTYVQMEGQTDREKYIYLYGYR